MFENVHTKTKNWDQISVLRNLIKINVFYKYKIIYRLEETMKRMKLNLCHISFIVN